MPNITALLSRAQQGDKAALDDMLPTLYQELHGLAHLYLSRERSNHTLQPTALVNEAYLHLIDQRQIDWRNRAHFLGIAAQVMRRVLLHHAEHRDALKRGGDAERVSLDEALDCLERHAVVDVRLLDAAMAKLAAEDERQARIVELRVFGGLTIEETAEVLGISDATVKREWRVARLWLRRELS